jgi:hypothetical protein
MYFQSLAVHLAPDGVRVAWTIAPGPLLAGLLLLRAIDVRHFRRRPSMAVATEYL